MSYQRTEISESDIQHQMDICAQLRAHFTAGGRQPLAMVDTYGCQQNEADSEKLRGYLRAMGFDFAQDEFAADVVVMNTCAVREHAETRVFGNVGALTHTKAHNPTQIIADMLTIKEQFGYLKGINLVYMGDARYNMGNSLMVGCAKLGLNFTACCPEKYFPNAELIKTCREIAEKTGSVLRFETDTDKAVKGADVIYTDILVSMGEPVEVWEERINDLAPYQVNSALMAKTGKKETVFMHCLPAYHDLNTGVGREMGERFNRTSMEVTNEVFESAQSVVFREAENRMHTIKAIMAATLAD